MQIRPQNIDNYIGNEELVEKIKISAEASKKLNKPFPHTMINGPSGSGKTTIAKIIGSMVDKDPKVINATGITNIKDLAQICIKAEEKDVIFIDEIHSLNIKLQEHLYSVLEDFKITVQLAKHQRDVVSIPTKKFTIVGATTNLGALSDPFVNRFGIIHNIQHYSDENIEKILEQVCEDNDIRYQNLSKIAKASRGIPRVAINLLNRCYDRIVAHNHTEINEDVIKETLKSEEINEDGLTRLDQKYMDFLKNQDAPAGLKTLAAALDEQEKTIEQFIEPFLLRKNLISKTSKGRVLNV